MLMSSFSYIQISGKSQDETPAGSVISGSLSGSATKIGVTLLGAIPSLREQRAGDILAR